MRIYLLAGAVALVACATSTPTTTPPEVAAEPAEQARALPDKYATFRLQADLSGLTDAQKKIVALLVRASAHADAAFWRQSFGDPDAMRAELTDDELRRYFEINYGPWDRLADNEPFIEGVGSKPKGAQFYPVDATLEEIEAADSSIRGLYTMVERKDGKLVAIPYSTYFAAQIEPMAALLDEAAALALEPGLKQHLTLRAKALRTDDYQPSDLAWMDMKDNAIDVVIGPIETYEDRLLGAKAAFESYVLLKDIEWSSRLQRYAALLPELQRGLPVDEKYKAETPGSDSDLNAYDVVYYAGDCNAGSKTIAINLPNDEEVQLAKGTRRLQLKNAMRAKFDKILLPIASVLIDQQQRSRITFDAFFANTMFHEVAHGLGIKKTVDGNGTVREALKDRASALEEGKADMLGLYMIRTLHEKGELEGDAPLEDYFTTFTASIFRSIRFGAASAHGRANLVRFNFFLEQGGIARDPESGTYAIVPEKFVAAGTALSRKLLELQGNGDYAAAVEFTDRYGVVTDTLRADLARVDEAGIPVDVVFEQGLSVLGLD